MKRTLSIVLCFLCFSVVMAQQQRWEGGLFLGGANYQGDLVDNYIPELGETAPAAGIFGRFALSPGWALRLGGYYGRFTGTDQNFTNLAVRNERNLSFETEVAEASFIIEWEPLGHRRYPTPRTFRKILSPYVFIGGGFSQVEPRADFSRTARDSYQDRIEQDRRAGFPLRQFSLPIGVGLRLDVSRKVVLGLELGTRTAFSDYLDGISNTGNPDANDWYTFAGLTVGRRFGPPDTDRDGFADKEDACPQVAGSITARGCPDRDGDGVEDLEDICPDDWGLARLSGCPDLDGDEIIDLMDACPRIAGSPDTEGCPDTDGDCIADADDDCPEDPGFEEGKGCPDSDFDGVVDKDDECPEEAGLPEKQGCPFVDTDEDGVEDEADRCPGLAGLPELEGCPDADADGIADLDDRCPTTAGVAGLDGCPELSEEDKAVLMKAREEVQFNTGSAVLKEKSHEVLDRIVEIMQRYPDYALRIGGHTDSVGKAENNQKLSEERARACVEYLEEQGVIAERMAHAGFGETQPIGDNQTVEGRRKNRRVEFELYLPE